MTVFAEIKINRFIGKTQLIYLIYEEYWYIIRINQIQSNWCRWLMMNAWKVDIHNLMSIIR